MHDPQQLISKSISMSKKKKTRKPAYMKTTHPMVQTTRSTKKNFTGEEAMRVLARTTTPPHNTHGILAGSHDQER